MSVVDKSVVGNNFSHEDLLQYSLQEEYLNVIFFENKGHLCDDIPENMIRFVHIFSPFSLSYNHSYPPTMSSIFNTDTEG